MSTIGNALKLFGVQGLLAYSRVKSGQTSDIILPGIRNTIRLRPKTDDVKLFKQLMFHREYEFSAPIQPTFIVDAGANIGLSALFFASKFPEATIVAIEPEKENYNLLRHNTRNYKHINSIHAGLWHKSTTLEVTNLGAGSTGFMVSETTPDNPNGFKAVSAIDVLHSNKMDFIDIFKIDIEGAEKEVLSENAGWLGKTKILIIELHDRKKSGCSKAFFQALEPYNFECHPFGQNFLLINRDLLPDGAVKLPG